MKMICGDHQASLLVTVLVFQSESFGSVTVGGQLDLTDNQIGSLRESFGSVIVGGNLILKTSHSVRPLSWARR